MIERIAKVREAFLGVEDHGHLTFAIECDLGMGDIMRAGMYSLDAYDPGTKKRHGTARGMEMIRRLLLAFNVSEWSKISGKTIFVLLDRDSMSCNVLGFRPLPMESGTEFLFADVMGDDHE